MTINPFILKRVETYLKERKRIPLYLKKQLMINCYDFESISVLAKQTGLSVTTLWRWQKAFSVQNESTCNNKVSENKDLGHHSESQYCRNESDSKLLCAIFFTCILCCEIYLMNNAFDYNQKVLQLSTFIILLKIFLGELLPLALLMSLHVFRPSFIFRFLIKVIIGACLFYGIYSVAGEKCQSLYKNEMLSRQNKEKIESLTKALLSANEDIHYYKNAPKSDGQVGWSLTVKSLLSKRDEVESNLLIYQEKERELGYLMHDKLNFIMELVFKAMIQFGVFLLMEMGLSFWLKSRN